MKLKSDQLTIFSVPKPFTESADIAQRNAIQSWKRLSLVAQIVLVGDEFGTAEVAKEYDVLHISDIKKNKHGTPLVSSAFTIAHQHSSTPFLMYCNCDIILFDDFATAAQRLIDSSELKRFLAIGRRTNKRVDRMVDFCNDDELNRLFIDAKKSGTLESIVCKEFFVFNRDLFDTIPEFAVGRGHWDNWIVYNAKADGIPVVSMAGCVLALHQDHGYSHLNGGRMSGYLRGIEARHNQKLGNGKHIISGSTSDYRMEDESIRPSRMTSLAGEFWMDFPRFARLLLKIIRNR